MKYKDVFLNNRLNDRFYFTLTTDSLWSDAKNNNWIDMDKKTFSLEENNLYGWPAYVPRRKWVNENSKITPINSPRVILCLVLSMMMSSNGNIFRVTGPLCGEFTGHWWIPHTKASDAELWCFLWSVPDINGWVNNREAGDLRRNRAHYDVIVMSCWGFTWWLNDMLLRICVNKQVQKQIHLQCMIWWNRPSSGSQIMCCKIHTQKPKADQWPTAQPNNFAPTGKFMHMVQLTYPSMLLHWHWDNL